MDIILPGDIFSMVTLNISNSTKNDSGTEYQFIVTNRFGQTSATARLNITCNTRSITSCIFRFCFLSLSDEPFFIVPSQNQTVKQGSNVTLEAQIDGNPTPDVYIEWFDFREHLQPVNNNQCLYQYNLYNVQLNDSVPYTFSALSEVYRKNISETVFLTVLGIYSNEFNGICIVYFILDHLYTTNLTNNISIEEDEHLNLTVQFSHSIIKSQWFINVVPIENTSIDYIDYISNDQAVLIIYNTSLRNNGQYEVQVWDILNQTNQSLIVVHIYSIRKYL